MSNNLSMMEAGPELDRLIAERVMGWDAVEWINSPYFKPSTQIEFAWRVVEKMRPTCFVMIDCIDATAPKWNVIIMPREPGSPFPGGTAICGNVPEAICRAALLAVQHKATP
jgi:hypothetical protein